MRTVVCLSNEIMMMMMFRYGRYLRLQAEAAQHWSMGSNSFQAYTHTHIYTPMQWLINTAV